MKGRRKSLINSAGAIMGIVLLLSSCFTFVTFYKCATRGTISFSRTSSQAYKCCCCKKPGQRITQNGRSSFKCCNAFTLKGNDYTSLNKGLSLIHAAAVERQPEIVKFSAQTDSKFPKCTAKVTSGVSPPVYLLKQSFLI